MALDLTDALIKGLPIPPKEGKGSKIYADAKVRGFGLRVTSNGARAFVLRYRNTTGRERTFTIGEFGPWRTAAARPEAQRLRRLIDQGGDPLAEIEEIRQAPTVGHLAERFVAEHLPKRRASTARDYGRAITKDILPALRSKKVAEVNFSDIDSLHRRITSRGSPYIANRTVAVLSKMFSLAVKWGWRADNPCRGIERNHEEKRQHYLSGSELASMAKALAEHQDQQAANIIRLLLLTGARKTEVLAARWEQFDLAAGVWTKPGATTKQKTEHRAPISDAAKQLLSAIKAEGQSAEWIFPGEGRTGHRADIKKTWAALCKAAGLGRARIHDLRHTHASILASAGMSLPIIGQMLGHTQASTTHRYSHLLDDPLRQAAERVAAVVSGKPLAEIVPLKSGGGQ